MPLIPPPPVQPRHPVLRDLAWLLDSPPLCKGIPPFADQTFFAAFSEPLWPRLRQLDGGDLSPLCGFNRHGRLGQYYEQLWILALKLHPEYRLLGRDLVLTENKITIGSLDFVVEHLPSRQLEHWEVAVKFYLGRGNGLGPDQWVGPGKKDRLGDKLRHLVDHQLPMLYSSQGQDLCHQNHWSIKSQRALVQGRLYLGPGQDTLPEGIAPNCLLGRWYPQSILPRRAWRQLGRRDWLSGRAIRLMPRFNQDAPLPWPRHLVDADTGKRVFVVPEEW